MKVTVLIPIFKSSVSGNELKSLHCCLNTLSHHPLAFIYPENLDISFYQKLAPLANFESFDPSFFNGVSGYNNLLLKSSFYRRFLAYEYMLIYQLDAWVFKDDLLAWCNKSYDYIGAPDYANKTIKISWHHKFLGRFLMNGGLSLRKTKTCLRLCAVFEKYFASDYSGHEDSFFSAHYSRFFLFRFFLRLPNYKTALQFAFEKEPEKEFELNDNQLPFACHAYPKYDASFWKTKGIDI